MDGMSYPVRYEIDRPERYNRWTVAFRAILVIPQAILVGGGGFYLSFFLRNTGNYVVRQGLSGGILSAVLDLLVFFAWFAILFTGRFPQRMRNFCLMLYRWQQNVAAYLYWSLRRTRRLATGPTRCG